MSKAPKKKVAAPKVSASASAAEAVTAAFKDVHATGPFAIATIKVLGDLAARIDGDTPAEAKAEEAVGEAGDGAE